MSASQAQARSQGANDLLTLEEIKTLYPSEWVLIADPEVNKRTELVRGKVVYHSKDREDVDRRAIELRLKHSAFLYTGEAPEDMEFVL